MNNKGQSLVVFVLILPIIILFIALLVNSGMAYYNKTKITGSIESNLEVILKQDIKDEVKIKNVLEKNLSDEEITIKVVDNQIFLQIVSQNNSLFENLMPSSKQSEYNYIGNYDNDTFYQE